MKGRRFSPFRQSITAGLCKVSSVTCNHHPGMCSSQGAILEIPQTHFPLSEFSVLATTVSWSLPETLYLPKLSLKIAFLNSLPSKFGTFFIALNILDCIYFLKHLSFPTVPCIFLQLPPNLSISFRKEWFLFTVSVSFLPFTLHFT